MIRSRLSVVILTKNEEARVARCLQSVQWVDEIVIVDGHSTDRTREICERAGAKVILHAFEDDFGLERNLGAEATTGDWILQLDADEQVSEKLKEEITTILMDAQGYAAFRFRRKNIFLGHPMRYGGWDHLSLHLYRKGFARYQGRVHETVLVNGTVGTLEAEVEHTPFSSISQFLQRQNRYTGLQALEIWEHYGFLPARTILYQLVVKPLKLFWKIYVKKQGFREGIHGYLFAVLFAWVHYLKWAKYWELREQSRRPLQKGQSS